MKTYYNNFNETCQTEATSFRWVTHWEEAGGAVKFNILCSEDQYDGLQTILNRLNDGVRDNGHRKILMCYDALKKEYLIGARIEPYLNSPKPANFR